MTTPEQKREAHRQLALDLSSKDREEWIERAHKNAVDFATVNGVVCADDIWDVTGPPPQGVSPKAMCGAFKGMVHAGWKKSTRPERQGGPLSIWRLP